MLWTEWHIEGERWSKVHAVNENSRLDSKVYTKCGKVARKNTLYYRNINGFEDVCKKCISLTEKNSLDLLSR